MAMLVKRFRHLTFIVYFGFASSSLATPTCLEHYMGNIQARIGQAQKEGADFSYTFLRMIEKTELLPQVYLETALSRFATKRMGFDEEKISQATNFLAVEEPKIKRTTEHLDRLLGLYQDIDALLKKMESKLNGRLAKILPMRSDKNKETYLAEFEAKLKDWVAAIGPTGNNLNYLADVIGTLERYQRELDPVLASAVVDFAFFEAFNLASLSSLEQFPRANRIVSQIYDVLSGQVEAVRNKKDRIVSVKTVIETNLLQLKLMKNLIELNRDNPIDQITKSAAIDDQVFWGRLQLIVSTHLGAIRSATPPFKGNNFTNWTTGSTALINHNGTSMQVQPSNGIPIVRRTQLPLSFTPKAATFSIPRFGDWPGRVEP